MRTSGLIGWAAGLTPAEERRKEDATRIIPPADNAFMVEMLAGRLSPRYSAAASGWSFERSRPPREIFATSLRSAITLTPSQQG